MQNKNPADAKNYKDVSSEKFSGFFGDKHVWQWFTGFFNDV